MRKYIAVVCCLAVLMAGCKNKSGQKDKEGTTVSDGPLSPEEKNTKLTQISKEILNELKNKNYPGISRFIDPAAGIRFSPYCFVDTAKDVHFSKKEYMEIVLAPGQAKRKWGESDGTGDPINMTLNEYMQEFVYDVDFLTPERFAVNEFIGTGNTINNLLKAYPGCDFTESYFSGFEEKYDGMDWRSLRLVFKNTGGEFYLVGIIHDEWTI